MLHLIFEKIKMILSYNTHHTSPWPQRLALLPDGRRFVSGSKDGTARIVEHGLVL